MKKTVLLLSLLIAVCINFSCKKKQEIPNNACESNINKLIGRWSFVSRNAIKISTGATVDYSNNTTITTKFDSNSFMEFNKDGSYKWHESYKGKIYQTGSDFFECENNSVVFFLKKSDRARKADVLKEVSPNKLIIESKIFISPYGGGEDLITTELKRVN